MAELVDARDLKCFAATEAIQPFCKTDGVFPIETDRTKRDLQNTRRLAELAICMALIGSLVLVMLISLVIQIPDMDETDG